MTSGVALAAVAIMLVMYERRSSFDGPASLRTKTLTVAVLPFRAQSVSEPIRHLGVGIPDAITSRLAGVCQLAPRPTSSVLQ